MKKLFSVIGWILIIASIITPLTMIAFQLPTFPYDILKEGILPGAIAFVLGFFPGIYLIKIGKGINKENKLNKTALILTLPLLIIGILLLITSAIAKYEYNPSYNDFALFLFLVFAFITSIPYGISLILLIIDYFKQRK